MSSLTVVGSVYTGVGNPFYGVNDLEFIQRGDVLYVVAASASNGSLQMYYVHSDQAPVLRDRQNYTEDTGSAGVDDIEFIDINGTEYLITSGRYDDAAGLVEIRGGDSASHLHYPESITGDADDYSYFELSRVIAIGDETYVLASRRNEAALFLYEVESDHSFNVVQTVHDTAPLHLGDLTDFETVVINGKIYVATVSAFDSGLHMFRLRNDGSLTLHHTVEPSDQSGFSHPQDIDFVISGGVQYLIMASSESDSLTVFRVGQHGHLHEVDHVVDSLNTRFEGASHLETITFNGRVFVFAAGIDDGLSILELLPDGQLVELLHQEDTFDIALTNVGSLAVQEINGQIHVIVGSATEYGFTQFIFDPDEIGVQLIGSTGKDTLVGGDGNDHLFGGRKGDYLIGGDGDDRLDGGNGKDHMYGGQGADTFVFQPDNRRDVVYDFEIGIDSIDLSAFAQVNTLDDLEFKARPWGAVIIIRGENIVLRADDGGRLRAEDFSMDDFIFSA